MCQTIGSAGDGEDQAVCACEGGAVCVQQIGGTPIADGESTPIECILPANGGGDACDRIPGEGACTGSPAVVGLCVCDNGVR